MIWLLEKISNQPRFERYDNKAFMKIHRLYTNRRDKFILNMSIIYNVLYSLTQHILYEFIILFIFDLRQEAR